MLDLIYFLLIGLAAGWLAGKLMEGRSFGLLGNLVVGAKEAIFLAGIPDVNGSLPHASKGKR